MTDEEKKIDWVETTYETFVKNASGLDPTDPVAAVEAYFEKTATAELKERAKAQGKSAAKCWDFIEAVARKVGGNCHIDPSAVYAMVMHYFEDVPVDWDEKPEKPAKPKKQPKPAKPAEAEKPKKPAKPKKAKKPEQFFFSLEETPPEGGAAC